MDKFAKEFLNKIEYLESRLNSLGKEKLNHYIEINDFEAIWDLAQSMQYFDLMKCDDDDTGMQRSVKRNYVPVFEAIKEAYDKYQASYPQRI